MKPISYFAFCLLACLSIASAAPADKPSEKWVQLFNGHDLTGWTPKITGYELGDNYADTYRVKDGLLKVRYDKYDGPFNQRFGLLFFERPFSRYLLRIEYRFVGDQIEGGPEWAWRNSGVMIHGQSAKSMLKDQDFVASIEVQFLGGNGKDPRTTANLCTPCTHVVMNGELLTQHCKNSNSKTYHGDQWVTVELEVRGNEVIRHKIDGRTVLEYTQPQLDPKDPNAKRLMQAGTNIMLTGGTISLQAESHPIDFRKVEILELED
jgi:hypothetical protein